MLRQLLFLNALFLLTFAHAQTWNNIGPDGGFFKDFVIHPTNSDIVYAGSDDGGGVWKTTDGGDSWELLTGDYPNFTGWHIEMDPDRPDTLYFCEMYGRYGILKTTDGGATLEHQTDGFNFDRDFQTTSLVVYPGMGDTVFAATGEAEDEYGRIGNGVFSSFNGGSSWNYSGLQGTAIPCIEISDANRLLAGTADEGLMYSDDVGETWTVHPDIPDTASILQINKKNGIVVVSAGANGMYMSDDHGMSFENIGSIGQFNFDFAILNTSPHLEIISSGFFGPTRYSSETGLWLPVADPLFDEHLLIGIDANEGTIYLGIFSSTEVIVSEDNGASWNKLSKNPVATEIRAVVSNPESDRIYATLQNSYNFSGDMYNKESLTITDDGTNWTRTGPMAHGLDLIMHPENPEMLYMGTFAQGLFKTTDGFDSWDNIRSGNKLIMGLEINPNNPDELLISEFDISMGEFGIYKSIDAGDSWYKTGDIVATDIAYTENDTVYFSHETGIYMSDDNAETLDLIPDYLGGEVVFCLEYAAPFLYAGTEEGDLYKIDQTGAVTDITGGWNEDKPTSIRNIIYSGNSIIVGLSGAEQDTLHNLNGGVWQSLDGGDSWTDLTVGMTNNNIFGNTGLAISNDGEILAGTYGQGILKSEGVILGLIDDHKPEIQVDFYPNPVQTDLHIQSFGQNTILALNIKNVEGKTAYQNSGLNTNHFIVNHALFETGVYFVTVKTAAGDITKKIMVQ